MALGGAETDAAYGAQPKSERDWLMSQIVERANMQLAYSRVMKNRGAPGVDGMRCEDLKAWLKANWTQMKQQLLDESYRPQAVRRVDIPKPQGGVMRPYHAIERVGCASTDDLGLDSANGRVVDHSGSGRGVSFQTTRAKGTIPCMFENTNSGCRVIFTQTPTWTAAEISTLHAPAKLPLALSPASRTGAGAHR